MLNSTTLRLENLSDKSLFWGFIISSILICNLGFLLDYKLLCAIPIGLSVLFFSINNLKNFYYLFFFLLPFSIEFELPGGFATDLPSEPLMIFLTGFTFLLFLKNVHKVSRKLFLHPISILVILHVVWILFTVFFSTNPVVSTKFLLAKLWYIIPFYYLPFFILKDELDFKKLFMALSLGVFIAAFYVLIRHALEGFTFASSYDVVRPIFRNHVNYAIMLLAYLPFLIYLSFRKKGKAIIKLSFISVLLVAIYFSYTRAAQMSVLLSIISFFVLKFKLTKYAFGLSLAGVILILSFLLVNNNYLNYAPDYERAVVHKKFDNLMEATTKLEDISTVERFYRWVAGIEMIKQKPMTGFGPATFFFEYKSHAVTSYKTYVSDNPEKSGIHNYYLMTTVEQGFPGLLILLALIIIAILCAENTIQAIIVSKERLLIYAATISLILICIVILINDLIEADKVGPFFFLCLSIITYYSAKTSPESP